MKRSCLCKSKCEDVVLSPLFVGVSIPKGGPGLFTPGGGLGSSGDTSITGGEGLGAILVSPSPLGLRSGEFLFLRFREVGADTGVEETAGLVVSVVSCC